MINDFKAQFEIINRFSLPPGKTNGNIFRKKNNISFGQPATLFLTDHKRLVKLNGSGAITVLIFNRVKNQWLLSLLTKFYVNFLNFLFVNITLHM